MVTFVSQNSLKQNSEIKLESGKSDDPRYGSSPKEIHDFTSESKVMGDSKLKLTFQNSAPDIEHSNKYDITVPRMQLDLGKLDVIRVPSELLISMRLNVRFKIRLNLSRTKTFDTTLVRDPEKLFEFLNLVTKQEGYLLDEGNYYWIDEKRLSENSQSTGLINSRVFLLWRNCNLDDFQVKRILTLGLCLLMNKIDESELVFYMKDVVKENTLNVKIEHKPNKYVLISVEAPIFSF